MKSLVRLQMAALPQVRHYLERDSNPGPWGGWKFLSVLSKITSRSEVWDEVNDVQNASEKPVTATYVLLRTGFEPRTSCFIPLVYKLATPFLWCSPRQQNA